LALTILGATACQTEGTTHDINEERRAFTGEEVFEGVFFGAGPVAELVPELFEVDPNLLSDADREVARRILADDRSTPEERAKVRQELTRDEAFVELKTSLFSWIHDVDPTFMERFGEAMQSGDHLEIDAMLDESVIVLGQVKDAHPEVMGDLTDEGRGQGWVWPCIAVNLVAVLNGGLAVNVAAAVNGFWFWWGGGTDKEHNPLARERTVDLLAERLAVE
jgi:SdpC family antimicrobial peptide